jgi:hypothetical protein
LLQGVDFLLTWALLGGVWRGDVVEANPLARSVLDASGWVGLALFKLAFTLIALVAVLTIARRRPALATRVAGVMCLMVLGVNGYSGWLLARPEDPSGRMLLAENIKSRSLDGEYARIREFKRQRIAVCRDWLERRITLPVALERLAAVVERHRPHCCRYQQARLPASDQPGQLVEYLSSQTSVQWPEAHRHRERLAAEMAEHFPASSWQRDRKWLPASSRRGGLLAQ